MLDERIRFTENLIRGGQGGDQHRGQLLFLQSLRDFFTVLSTSDRDGVLEFGSEPIQKILTSLQSVYPAVQNEHQQDPIELLEQLLERIFNGEQPFTYNSPPKPLVPVRLGQPVIHLGVPESQSASVVLQDVMSGLKERASEDSEATCTAVIERLSRGVPEDTDGGAQAIDRCLDDLYLGGPSQCLFIHVGQEFKKLLADDVRLREQGYGSAEITKILSETPPVHIPRHTDIPPVLTIDSDGGHPVHYGLRSAIVRSGTVSDGGHFVAYLLDCARQCFVQHDGELVFDVSCEEALADISRNSVLLLYDRGTGQDESLQGDNTSS